MTNWPTRPNRNPGERSYDLLRCPAKGVLEVTILSSEVTGALTHYFHGRTRLHKELDCPACLDGHAPRWYGYLACLTRANSKISIIEFTPAAEEQINTYYLQHGALRGARLLMRRKNERPNGKLQVVIDEGKFSPSVLPPEFDVRAVLEKMWEVNENWGNVSTKTRTDLSIVDNETREKILAKAHQAKASKNGKH